MELERGNFLKPTDTEGVWEFNMVERDIVYEVNGLESGMLHACLLH